MKQAVEVVAALIWKQDDGVKKMMICQRPPHKTRGLLWEFVGGKVEEGETKEQALIHECSEELDVTVKPEGEFMDVLHEYPDLTVHLTLFHASIDMGEPRLLEHRDLKWISPTEIHSYAFCPADEEILNRILFDHYVQSIPTGQWRHFKGNAYEVVGIARHSETLAPMVIYRALYGDGGLWTRPAEMWNETVERDGKVFPRFEYEGEAL